MVGSGMVGGDAISEPVTDTSPVCHPIGEWRP
jgi:hypothetical protein